MSTRSLTQTKPTPKPSFTPVKTGILQRKCACGNSASLTGKCTECENKRLTLQRRSHNQAKPDEVPPIVHEVLNSPGQRLDPDTRTFMESRLSHDFSSVRVHTDTKAAKSARAVNALAYTVGHDVVFDTGQYAPHTSAGRQLLAHELAHVLQQGNRSNLQSKLKIGAVEDRFEREANNIAQRVFDNQTSRVNLSPSLQIQPGVLQRAAIYRGNILFEGTCEHLACNSVWSCCNPESTIHCPGKTRSNASSSCPSERWTPLFTCDSTCDRAIEQGCDDSGNWMAIPNGRFERRKCGQDLVICANGRSTHARVRDRSEGEHWEVSPGIIDALGVPRGTFTGSIYGNESDPDFRGDSRCRSAATGAAAAVGSAATGAAAAVVEAARGVVGSATEAIANIFDWF